MKIIRFFLRGVLVFLLCMSVAYAQDLSIIETIIERREAVVKINVNSKSDVFEISKITGIDKFENNSPVVYLNAKQYGAVSGLGLEMEIYAPYYSKTRSLSMANSIAEMSNWDKYPTWAVLQQMMLDFATDYPDICRLDTIGFSEEGRAILVVKISDNVNEDEIEPEFLLSGQMHGDELVSYILPLRMIDYLLSNYGSNAQVDNLINNLEIWINPLSNPDGTYGDSETDVSGSTRYNANGVDLNRNFPDPNGSWNPDGNETAIENIAMMNFAAERHFVMSANSHSGAEVVNYPWDSWAEVHADDDWLYEISRKYADTVHANAPSGYFTLLDDGITNGYAWYTTNGSRQDYFNYYEHCREVTLEWSNDKLLDSEELPVHWNYNRNAMLNYFAEALEGVHGIVTDSITDEPIEAQVFIEGHDERNTQVYSELPNGDYHRLLYAGEWSLTFSADGYQSKTKTVNLSQDERIDMDVQLVPLSELPPQVNFYANQTEGSCNPVIQFTNTTEAVGDLSFEWNFGDGSSSEEENPLHVYQQNGLYDVSLVVTNENGAGQEIKNAYIEISLTSLDSVHSASLCESNGSLELQAFSDGEILWFENLNDELSIETGETFTTPVLDASETYYAQAIFAGETNFVGETNTSDDGDYDNTDTQHYLIFDCFDHCELQEVTVYAETTAERTISLRNAAGEVLQEKTLNISAGEQTISLNFELSPGENYQLAVNANSGLYRGRQTWTNTFDYPYEIDMLSIKNSDAGIGWGTSEQVYPYFYNWEVKSPDCYTERQAVYAVINESPSVDFYWDAEGLNVTFENLSSNYIDLLWSFGDETTSEETNPQHAYSQAGEYVVTLTAYNDCGDMTDSETISISESLINQNEKNPIVIYPNPAKHAVTIQFLNGLDYTKVEFIDLTGKILHQEGIQSNEINWSVEQYQTGMYLVRFFHENGSVEYQKIMIKH